ncbi:response regulator [Desulfovibrio inopinatus]|uniref:response regulator n=1 Tax=Desulfovibrio inopinatus TaxID=102109 RepID=UPI0003F61908|nr:response regulator [Desulfovibrio inopinatus]
MREILVIDDEKPTLSMFSLYLEAYGHTVITAENGEEGLELFKERKPSIVITDIKMPGMDGLEVLQRIKGISPLTEVIVITGHGDIDLALKALNLNATDFIDKPISREALEAALNRADERLIAVVNKTDEIEVNQVGDVAIIEIRGNVTSRSEPFLIDAYKDASGETGLHKLILHFDDAASINGAGIAVLTQLLMESEKRGQPVAIAGPSDNFRKVFDIVGITRIVKIYDTAHAALAALEKTETVKPPPS